MGQQYVEVNSFEYGVIFIFHHKDFWIEMLLVRCSCSSICVEVINFRLCGNVLVNIKTKVQSNSQLLLWMTWQWFCNMWQANSSDLKPASTNKCLVKTCPETFLQSYLLRNVFQKSQTEFSLSNQNNLCGGNKAVQILF